MAEGFTDADVPDQSGRTLLVTGANTGIGFETSRVLADRGARVLLACRDVGRAQRAVDRIRRDVASADLGIVELDLGSLASVESAAAQVAEQEDRLDVLVNNAGVMAPPYGQTEDGFETQLGVNHLGPFALTCLLLPVLAEHADGRVVSTSSIAHRTGDIEFDDLVAARSYDAFGRYRQSKLANLLFALELDRRLSRSGSTTISAACHPGIAGTDLGRHISRFASLLSPLVQLVHNSAAQGAWPALMAATDPTVGGGEYLGPLDNDEQSGPAGRAYAVSRARDEQLAARLWSVSIELTGIDPGI